MSLFLAVFSILCVLFIRRLLSRNALKSSLPPGPKPSRIPLIGNLLDFPSSFPWETFDKWYKESQSELTYLNAAGSHILILNTYEAAMDLLHGRSTLYSSRVRLPMLDLIKLDSFALLPYGDRWRRHRRLFHQVFNETNAERFHPQLTKAALRLLLRLVDRPDNILNNIKYVVGSMIFSVTYGIETSSDNDPLLTHAERTTHDISSALIPGAFWVDFIPWLKYVPRWFPGAGFQHKAEQLRAKIEDMVTKPYEIAKQRVMEGNRDSSFVAQSLGKILTEDTTVYYDENDLKNVAVVTFGGGAETTIAFLSTFMLAMLLHPEAQQKAQLEIDEVLKGALPTLEDRDSLPYVTALVKEVLRWKPVLPLGLPHCLISEDVYKGYRIPAGTMVAANIWSMFHDEAVYTDPAMFNPDRFLENGKLNHVLRDPETITFGFGRRICPGRYMAASFIWIAAASILATLDITKAVDKDGNVIEPVIEFESAVVYVPKPFPCSVNPRKSMRDTVTKVYNDLEMI